MEKIYTGDNFKIHAYKHDGRVYRAWDEAILLDAKKDYLVFGNNKTTVMEIEGITWKTKEPAIMYFFKNEWYNVIAQLKKDGTYYKCNIATPFVIEEKTIKYIDYDLDLRIFPNRHFKILDRLEYEYHRKLMNYSSNLDKVVNKALDELIGIYINNSEVFNNDMNKEYCELYQKIVGEQKSSNV